jgi:hypothetical protein
MALIRTVIVVGAVIALLPSDRAQQERLQQAAVDAAQWTITYCDRNAKSCETAAAAWNVFKAKAEFAAGVAYDVAMTHVFKASMDLAANQAPAETTALSDRGTLTARDLEPRWRAGEQPSAR